MSLFCGVQNSHGNLGFFSRNIIEKSFEFFFKISLWETCLHLTKTVIMQIFVQLK